jgi:four helix bundle protein
MGKSEFGIRKGDDLKSRTKRFALQVLKFVDEFPRSSKGEVLSRQLIRSAPSVGANYRAACRAKSRPDFISKLGNVEEEIDEAAYWLELIEEAGVVASSAEIQLLLGEADELTAIIVSSIKRSRTQFAPPSSKPFTTAFSSL